MFLRGAVGKAQPLQIGEETEQCSRRGCCAERVEMGEEGGELQTKVF
jgi:hypothetical protein